MKGKQLIVIGVAIFSLGFSVPSLLAHQPFFEEQDISPKAPWLIENPHIATAFYGTLEFPGDVDAFVFSFPAQGEVLFSILIPQIQGHEDFTPLMVLLGPGLPAKRRDLPPYLPLVEGEGILLFTPPEETPSPFYESWSRTSYWRRQRIRVTLPTSGTYRLVIWHPQGRVGRYLLAYGEREIPGGDPQFCSKIKRFFTPPETSSPNLQVILFWSLVGFFSGSCPFAVWLGRLLARIDIRRYGDGNPGAANAWRAGGWRVGFPSLLSDYLKAAIPAYLASRSIETSEWGIIPAALAPVIGHVFSPLLRWRGGKGIASSFGIWTALTLWFGPVILGSSLSIALLVNTTDAWSAILGFAILFLALLHSGAPLPLFLVWGGNVTLILAKHYQELRTPPRLRPFYSRKGGSSR